MNLIKKCLDANPLNRPTAGELNGILWKWYKEAEKVELTNKLTAEELTELQKQIREVDEINKNLQTNHISSTKLSYETHSEAIYTSRLLNFNNLPEPKNSDDYYKQNDNIISMKFSGN